MAPSRKRKVSEICSCLEHTCVAARHWNRWLKLHKSLEDLMAGTVKYLVELNLAAVWHHPRNGFYELRWWIPIASCGLPHLEPNWKTPSTPVSVPRLKRSAMQMSCMSDNFIEAEVSAFSRQGFLRKFKFRPVIFSPLATITLRGWVRKGSITTNQLAHLSTIRASIAKRAKVPSDNP
jgi:hypothetical protein